MQKLSIDEFAYPAGPTGIGELNTVSNGPENEGANANLAKLFWKCLRHGTTAEAVSNSLTPRALALTSEESAWTTFSGGVVNVGGHGDAGFLETGAGQSGPFVKGKYIAYYTESDWGPQLDRLNTPSLVSLSIWSCHTGAEQPGADLLYRMAVRCGRMVRAGTGFLYSNSQRMWWETGSVWQVATPDNKPAPINRPNGGTRLADKILIPAAGDELGPDAVTSLEISSFASGHTTSTASRLDGEDAQNLASTLFAAAPLDMKDVIVSGFVTGGLVVTFKSGATATFDVYNESLAVERQTRSGYYLPDRLSQILALVAR